MKSLRNTVTLFALGIFIGGLLLLSYSTFSESTSSSPLPADIESLNKRFGVIRSESLFTGDIFASSKTERLLANIFYPSLSSESSQILVETNTGETILLTSKEEGISSEMVSAYEELPSIRTAEENQEGILFSDDLSEDLEDTFSPENNSLKQTSEKQVSPSVLVAVLDSGIDLSHPALSQAIWENDQEKKGTKGVDDDRNGLTDDIFGWNFLSQNADIADDIGHGTHIAGIIAAHETSISSMQGVSALGTKLISLKIADKEHGLRLSAVLRALEYAREQNVDVVNMSFGFSQPSSLLEDSITKIVQNGGVVISAAGNSGDEQKFYPAAYPEVYAVSSSLPQGGKWKHSTYGSWVDASAPARLLSTLPGGGYGTKTGTSQAAAFMTGAYAHEKFLHPQYTPDELLENLDYLSKRFSEVPLPTRSDLPNSSQEWISSALQALRMQSELSEKQKASLDMDRLLTKTEAIVLLGEFFPEWDEIRLLLSSHIESGNISSSPYDLANTSLNYDDLSRELFSFSEAESLLRPVFAIARSKKEVPSVPEIFGKYVFLTRAEFYDLMNIYFVQ